LFQLRRGEYREALAAYQSVVAIVQKLADERGENLAYRSMWGTALDKQSVVLWLLDRRDEAIESAGQATVQLQSAVNEAPRVVQYRLSLSDNYFNRAKFERERGHATEAVQLTRERKKLWPGNAAELYKAACELSLAARAAGGTEKVPAIGQQERKQVIDEAIQVLKEALAAGPLDTEALRKDPRLDALRSHPEFEKLLKSGDKANR
jgi:tetratricopeptide (TPR) repeat protein